MRIVGGAWRRRLVSFPDLPGLRPTPDRVRETLFNWLGQDLTGWSCLDLFAGSGVLGLEAASRGAARVTLVERDRAACRALSANAAALGGAERVEVRCEDALQFLPFCPRSYDLVFLDPPFREAWLDRIAQPLRRVVSPGGFVYAEAETPLAGLGPWKLLRAGRAGQVHFHLLQQPEEP